MVHPFHPLRGVRFALVARRVVWGHDRILFQDPNTNMLNYIPASWTDIDALDPLVELGRGRACFRLPDLLALRGYVDSVTEARAEVRRRKANHVKALS